jgi:hypothetical protein
MDIFTITNKRLSIPSAQGSSFPKPCLLPPWQQEKKDKLLEKGDNSKVFLSIYSIIDAGILGVFRNKIVFKGSLTGDFRSQFFFHESVSPRPPSILLGPF